MSKSAAAKIDDILDNAFEIAARILDAEVRNLLRRSPHRYSRFVLAVGWGPTLFDSNGKITEDLTKQATKVMALANKFYDRCGGDNREITQYETP